MHSTRMYWEHLLGSYSNILCHIRMSLLSTHETHCEIKKSKNYVILPNEKLWGSQLLSNYQVEKIRSAATYFEYDTCTVSYTHLTLPTKA